MDNALATTPRQLLPVAAYTGQEWFQREQAQLFGRSWLFAGMAEDLAQPGDYQCIDLANIALILLRDRKGDLVAFHNICRHRGARLLDGKGRLGPTLTCFYHRWSYDLSGALIGVSLEADQFDGLDRACLGLHRASVGRWGDLIFVHPEPGLGDKAFADWLGEVPNRPAPGVPGRVYGHHPERLVQVSSVRYRVRANWKVVVENFIDGYHLPLLHPVSLGDADFMGQQWTTTGRHITFYRPLKAGVRHDGLAYPLIDGLPADFGAAYTWLFPNLGVYETATTWSTFQVIPVAADLSIVHSRLRAMPAALDGVAPEPLPDLPDPILELTGPLAARRLPPSGVHPLQSNHVMLEDVYACEAVQRGLSSPRGTIGPLSRWELPLMFFQRQILDSVGDTSIR